MKRNLTLLSILFFVINYAQKIKDSKFLVGIESGINSNVSDYINDDKKTSLQFGVLAEYQLTKSFSVMSKIKYYESQVNFAYSKIIGSGTFGNQYQFYTSNYDGKIISVPFTINYNFRIYDKLSGSLRIGSTLNFETSSKYEYPIEVKKDYSSFFIGLSGGADINYHTQKIIYFVGFEPYFGAERGTTTGKDFNNQTQTHNYRMENYLLNLGVKFKLK